MRSLLLLLALFAAAVALTAIHPLLALLFLVAAKFVEIIWSSAAESYRARMGAFREKPKRRHVLTIDGEQLEITSDEDGDNSRTFTREAHG